MGKTWCQRPQADAQGRDAPSIASRTQILAREIPARKILASAVLVLAFTGCQPRAPWNVLLVTFDTTRADHLACYGNPRAQTPNIDRLAREGVLFRHAYSAVPVTAPSHSTILTGTYPMAHGVRDNGLFTLAPRNTTLAEILAAHGYATAAAVGSFPLSAKFGLDQGFELYDDHFRQPLEDALGRRMARKPRLYFDERPAGRVNEAIFPWLEAHSRQPFFLWLHYFDPHHPLEPPPPYNQLFANDPYLGEIAYADEALGKVIARLEALGVDDHTLVVFTADHGEGRGDHNEETHSLLAYNSTLHVPLIMHAPSMHEPVTIDQRVGTVDIVPTVLDLLGVDAGIAFQGRSLRPLIEARGAATAGFPRTQYAETLSPRLSQGLGELRVLFDHQYKMIYGPRAELYDLANDPGEHHNLIAQRELADALESKLADFISSHAARDPEAVMRLDAETRGRLQALGYIHADSSQTSTIIERLDASGTPPQDRVSDINDISTAKNLLLNNQPLAALQLATALVERDRDNTFYLQLRATAELQLGQLDKALQTLDTIRSIAPEGLPLDSVVLRAAAALQAAGRAEQALALVGDLEAVRPTASGHWFLASLHRSLGEPELARFALEHALELDATFAEARVDLAVDAARRGDLETAERELRQALADGPYYPKAHYNLAVVRYQRGDTQAALSGLARAIELEPGYLQARLALITFDRDLGRDDEAARQLEALVALAPDSAQARSARALLAGSS